MEQAIKTIAYKLLEETSEQWDIQDDRDALLYKLAYNDGVLAMSNALIKNIKEAEEQKTKKEQEEG